MKSKRSGFTLIELLTVIAIIALLAAILFPTFSRARENARRASCQSNQKQIGLGIAQYTQDYDERMPWAWQGGSNGPSGATEFKWMDAIYTYVKSEQVFNCPSHSFPATGFGAYKQRSGTNYGSYAINASYYATGDAFSGAAYSFLPAIQSPSTTVLTTDGDGNFETEWASAGTNPPLTNTNPRTLNHIIERHLDTVVVLYADSHVKSEKLAKLATPKAVNGSQVLTAFTIEDD